MLRKITQHLGRKSESSEIAAVIHLAQQTIKLLVLRNGEVIQNQIFDDNAASVQENLRAAIRDIPGSSMLHLVLSAEHYQLVQLDKPAVAADEMLQALPWQVKELVTVPPEDMLLDYIDLPGGNSQQTKISVVVASLSWLQQVVALVDAAGLQVSTIVPDEWLLPRLLPKAEQATMLVAHQQDQEVLIQIVRDGLLYFSRRTRGFSRINLSSETELREGMLDRLLLELQRSMDYFESQLKQPPVRDIRLMMANTDLMCQLFRQNGFTRTEPLTPYAGAPVADYEELLLRCPVIAVENAIAAGKLKQHVNLYQPLLHPVRERLSLQRLAVALTSLVAVVAVSGLLLLQQHSQAATALANTQLNLTQQLEQITLYQQALSQRKADDGLIRQYQQAERAVAHKQQLLDYLSVQQQQASQVYSPVLQHLQQIDIDDLWLQNFALRQQHSSFSGITLKPASVTLWLESLRQLGYFRGQRFSQVSLTQVEGETAVGFELIAQQGDTP
ncbi:type II secretion system protein GspL [Rheinheimera maricola]|uniref:GspL cytoplasmic actin-ATPase-like domain-containing protein n=1 Tax=Rheinheimera maricola TaxID=2793282 RepID=A0ABS7XE18_9GAMM|nr:type II secretion system protein GspL [Rheinheimera maricola]MBZ9613819.1 hypothetical protein [Rheinheimera maricola]